MGYLGNPQLASLLHLPCSKPWSTAIRAVLCLLFFHGSHLLLADKIFHILDSVAPCTHNMPQSLPVSCRCPRTLCSHPSSVMARAAPSGISSGLSPSGKQHVSDFHRKVTQVSGQGLGDVLKLTQLATDRSEVRISSNLVLDYDFLSFHDVIVPLQFWGRKSMQFLTDVLILLRNTDEVPLTQLMSGLRVHFEKLEVSKAQSNGRRRGA